MTRSVVFAVPGPLETKTGGFVYDRRVVEGLRRLGRPVKALELAGAYPFPDCAEVMNAETRFALIPDGTVVVVDGLAFGALPSLAERHAQRLTLVALVHHPLAEETGLSPNERQSLACSETRALASARRVIASSTFTARRLSDYGVSRDRIHIVPPGTDPAPRAKGSGRSTPALLCVASLTKRKGHADLLHALSGLLDLPWTLTCVGDGMIDPRTARDIHVLCTDLGLSDRVSFHEAVEQDVLSRLYDRADVFVLASHYEGFGMVATEAVAHGLPIVATTGGALADTVPQEAALTSPPGDIGALRANLRRALTDPDLRARLSEEAWQARKRLSGWDSAIRAFDTVLFGSAAP